MKIGIVVLFAILILGLFIYYADPEPIAIGGAIIIVIFVSVLILLKEPEIREN